MGGVVSVFSSVERRNSDVPCPECGGETVKRDYPLRPMPDRPKPVEDVTTALGLVYCEHCDDTYQWTYEQPD